MALYIDVSYLKQLSPRLPLFKQRGDFLWNCRCIICGDSSTKKNKTRGYFYKEKQNIMYKCHNCGVCMHFGTFLKDHDPSLYEQYTFERYAAGEGGRPNAHVASAEELFKGFAPVDLTPENWEDNILNASCRKVSTLPDDHEAKMYCVGRQIPKDKLHLLYAVEQIRDLTPVCPAKYTNALNYDEPRLVIPFHKENGKVVGVSLRALRGEARRYISVRFDEDAEMIFGLNRLDKTKPMTIVEGQFDSLFLDNSIACAGTSFGKIETMNLSKDLVTVVFDNQPRNKEVVGFVEKYIDLGYKVYIWPKHVQEKDINEMVLAGIDPVQLIAENTYQGLMAKLQFTEWRM